MPLAHFPVSSNRKELFERRVLKAAARVNDFVSESSGLLLRV